MKTLYQFYFKEELSLPFEDERSEDQKLEDKIRRIKIARQEMEVVMKKAILEIMSSIKQR